jgi:hypothetical protein
MNVSNWLKRSNGWPRIWLVLSVFYLIPTVIFTVSFFPATVQIDYRSWARATIKQVVLNDPSVWDDKFSRENPIGVIVRTDEILNAYAGMGIPRSKIIKRIQTKYTDEQAPIQISFDSINNRFKKESREVLFRQIAIVVGGITQWFIVIGMLYGLGWTIGWIYRGF